jgi:hypothetical protein
MTARTTFLVLAGILSCGLATTTALAADFGVSFYYSSHSPRYYTTTASRHYTTCYPRDYVYYDYYPRYYDDYYRCDPAVYVRYPTSRVLVCDDRYPTTYRTTYTRSRCYTAPVRHVRTRTYYRSGCRTRHDPPSRAYRYHYSTPRPRITLHSRSGSHSRQSIFRDRYRGSHHRYVISRDRHRGSHHRDRDSRHRDRRSPRIRVHRR